jgi:predicted transposase/invertase (TIGR01784 family)
MYDLVPLRKTRVWQEAEQEGREQGRQEKSEQLVQKLLAKGMPIHEIAALVDTAVREVRRLNKNGRRRA